MFADLQADSSGGLLAFMDRSKAGSDEHIGRTLAFLKELLGLLPARRL